LPPAPAVVALPSEEGLYISEECVVLPFWREKIICDGELLVQVPFASDNGQPIVMNQPDPELISSSDTSDIVSFIVDIHFEFPGATMEGDVKVCIRPDPNIPPKKDICLGFLDTSFDPPEWSCSAVCLEKEGDLLCGYTDHFTNFALLLGANTRGGGSSDCDLNNDFFVTGSPSNDVILLTSCGVFMCFISACFLFCSDYFTPLSKLVYGEDGYRIRRLRWNSTKKFLPVTDTPVVGISPSGSGDSSDSFGAILI